MAVVVGLLLMWLNTADWISNLAGGLLVGAMWILW